MNSNDLLPNFLSKAIGIINLPFDCSSYCSLLFYYFFHKEFSKFYRRHFGLIEKYHVSLKKLMQQGIFNPKFYGDLVSKFKKIIGNPNFKLGPEPSSVAWSTGAQLIIRFSVVLFGIPGISIRNATHCICRVLVFASS